MVGDEFANGLVEDFTIPFAGSEETGVVFGVDQEEGRPGANAEFAPDDHFGVVEDRVGDFVADDGVTDVVGDFFVVEFGGMDSDDDEFVGVFFFEVFEIGEDVHAVDAAVGPEVEEDDFAFEFIEGEFFGGVKPFGSFDVEEVSREGEFTGARVFGSIFSGFVLSAGGRSGREAAKENETTSPCPV